MKYNYLKRISMFNSFTLLRVLFRSNFSIYFIFLVIQSNNFGLYIHRIFFILISYILSYRNGLNFTSIFKPVKVYSVKCMIIVLIPSKEARIMKKQWMNSAVFSTLISKNHMLYAYRITSMHFCNSLKRTLFFRTKLI